MVTKNYLKLKNKISEMNKLNDELSLLKWNKDIGPKFASVEEMKDFEQRLMNGDFDFLFPESKQTNYNTLNSNIIEDFKYKKDNIIFYIYTIKKNDNFIMYLSINKDNDILDKLCGRQSDSKDITHSYFEELKHSIIDNTIDDIFSNLIKGADNTINTLKNKIELLTSKS